MNIRGEIEMRKILFTAFKGKNNTSYQLVSQLPGEHLYLTNSFTGLEEDIKNYSNEFDIAIMFGIDKSLQDCVRLEKSANDGKELLNTSLDIDGLEIIFKENDVNCYISEKPTNYLCNTAYFHMLKKMSGNVVLIHIPSLRNMTKKLEQKMVNIMKNLKEFYV